MSAASDSVTLCYALYAYPDSPKVAWDYLDDGTNSDGIYWAAVRLNGILWAILRGSVLLYPDWLRDFYDWQNPFLHDDLGPIHPGFYQGIPLVRDKLLSLAKPDEPIRVGGHSLGAGRGRDLVGELVLAGRPPHYELFGEPHAGGAELFNITSKATGNTYRNIAPTGPGLDDHDLVTAAPPWFNTPPNRQDFKVTPKDKDPWGLFRFHHLGLYAGAVDPSRAWDA